jgi:hypothetical protein
MVAGQQTVEFILSGKLEGVEITPQNIGLHLFNQFNSEVEDLIVGSQKGLRLTEAKARIEEGSYKLKVGMTAALLANFEPDLRRLNRQDSLGEIDPERAKIIQRWQARAKSDQAFQYEVRSGGAAALKVQVSSGTDYHVGNTTPWIVIEQYLFGRIVDMGGAQKANVHLALEGTGRIQIVGASEELLREQKENRLYHKALLRVRAEQHTRTGELRNIRLIDFQDYDPNYNEKDLEKFIEEGTKAWADVPDASAWVRDLRGGS